MYTEGVMAGAKAAVVATIATAIPTVSTPSTYSIFIDSFNNFAHKILMNQDPFTLKITTS